MYILTVVICINPPFNFYLLLIPATTHSTPLECIYSELSSSLRLCRVVCVHVCPPSRQKLCSSVQCRPISMCCQFIWNLAINLPSYRSSFSRSLPSPTINWGIKLIKIVKLTKLTLLCRINQGLVQPASSSSLKHAVVDIITLIRSTAVKEQNVRGTKY